MNYGQSRNSAEDVTADLRGTNMTDILPSADDEASMQGIGLRRPEEHDVDAWAANWVASAIVGSTLWSVLLRHPPGRRLEGSDEMGGR